MNVLKSNHKKSAKLAANISLLWPELPFLDRFGAAAAAGFNGVEVLYPYATPAPEIQAALRETGLEMVLINTPPPNYTGGARGFAAIPGGEERFQYDMRRVFRYAEVLGARRIHIMAGEAEGEEAFSIFVKNLKWASRMAPKGVLLLIEPLNDQDFPGYFLNDYGLAARVLDSVKKPNVRLQFDAYHAQMIHGDAVEVWNRYGLRASHVQIADAPGRDAPGTGTIDFPALFDLIRAQGYDGWISAEYKPSAALTEKTLGWMARPWMAMQWCS